MLVLCAGALIVLCAKRVDVQGGLSGINLIVSNRHRASPKGKPFFSFFSGQQHHQRHLLYRRCVCSFHRYVCSLCCVRVCVCARCVCVCSSIIINNSSLCMLSVLCTCYVCDCPRFVCVCSSINHSYLSPMCALCLYVLSVRLCTLCLLCAVYVLCVFALCPVYVLCVRLSTLCVCVCTDRTAVLGCGNTKSITNYAPCFIAQQEVTRLGNVMFHFCHMFSRCMILTAHNTQTHARPRTHTHTHIHTHTHTHTHMHAPGRRSRLASVSVCSWTLPTRMSRRLEVRPLLC